MKVLLVAKPWRGGLADYVLRALRAEFGADVSWLATAPVTSRERLRYRTDKTGWRRRLVEGIAQGDYDLVLCINHLPEFAELRPNDRQVLWLTDDPRPVAAQVQAFGTILLSDPGYSDEFVRLVRGRPQIAILPFACDPEFHAPVAGSHASGPCFIANRDVKRDEHLRWLFAHGKRLTVYGNHFLHGKLFWTHPTAFRPAVAFERMGSVYARHSFSLNVHAAVVRGGTNMRSFECAAFGIPQLVEDRPGIDQYFEPGEEILTYRDVDELNLHFDRLDQDAHLRVRLAEQARKRVLAEHTYRKRMSRLRDLVKNLRG